MVVAGEPFGDPFLLTVDVRQQQMRKLVVRRPIAQIFVERLTGVDEELHGFPAIAYDVSERHRRTTPAGTTAGYDDDLYVGIRHAPIHLTNTRECRVEPGQGFMLIQHRLEAIDERDPELRTSNGKRRCPEPTEYGDGARTSRRRRNSIRPVRALRPRHRRDLARG